jgi:hypothetical protein
MGNNIRDINLLPGEVNQTYPQCGDFNYDNVVGISDIVFMINYIYVSGEQPQPIEMADVNCDLRVNLVDVIYLVNYAFRGGHEPCHDCR